MNEHHSIKPVFFFENGCIYLEAIETGVLSKFDVYTAWMLLSLQIKVSHIRATTLWNSLSYFGVLFVVMDVVRRGEGKVGRGPPWVRTSALLLAPCGGAGPPGWGDR
ncbi:hypothetical protein C8R44DRAFT_879301 [Mycena epipterygia]|nr:hypothetical protein C8R44DRAFT_879301 [Mycena epipterygia]